MRDFLIGSSDISGMGPTGVTLSGVHEWHDEWGRRHRVGGPAVIYPNGTRRWYNYGKLHCEDGPAVILADGSEEWWLNGKRINHKVSNFEEVWRFKVLEYQILEIMGS